MRKLQETIPIIEVWVLSSTSGWKNEVRQGKRLGSWQFTKQVNKLRIQISKRPKDYSQLTILGGTFENLLKTYRILQVKKEFLGWIQVFPAMPHLLRGHWKCFTEDSLDSYLSDGWLPKQLECFFSQVFCSVLYLNRIQNWYIIRLLYRHILPLQIRLEHILINAILQ